MELHFYICNTIFIIYVFCKNIKNPYEGKSTSAEIVDIIKQYLQNGIDLKKKFYDLDIG